MVPAGSLLVPFYLQLSWINPSPSDSAYRHLKYSASDHLVKVYPNPFKRELVIEYESKNDVSEVEIYNMLGEKMVVRAGNGDGSRISMNVDYSDPEAEPNVTKWQTLITFPMK